MLMMLTPSSLLPNGHHACPSHLHWLGLIWMIALVSFVRIGTLLFSGQVLPQLHQLPQVNNTPAEQVKTAVVMRTVAPIRPPVLEKIYRFAIELHMSGYSSYDFWIMVDETKNNQTNELIETFFAKHGGHVEPPKVFTVSEKRLLEIYPSLASYIYNEPELNFNNEPGLCCGAPIMWQMFIPTFAMFMTETQYKYGWSFEDDIGLYGQLSLLEIMREWDLKLNMDVDLAAIQLIKKYWGAQRHTNNMERIVQSMVDASVEWKMYSDSIQRHSLAMAEIVFAEVSNNVMQFGERLIYPIAWKHNRTTVDLAEIKLNCSIYGLEKMTGEGKLSGNQGIESLLKTNATPATFLFHERLPKIR